MNLQGGFWLPSQSDPSTCCGLPAFRAPGIQLACLDQGPGRSGQGTGPIIGAWVTAFGPGNYYSGKAKPVSIALPYDPPSSPVVHKYIYNPLLIPNQGLDAAVPDSIPSLSLPQLWRGEGGGCEGTSPSWIGTRHAVAFSGRGGGRSRRASGEARRGQRGRSATRSKGEPAYPT